MTVVRNLALASLIALVPLSAHAAELWETAQQHDDLTTFRQLVEAAGLDETLASSGARTVFAPNDVAFEGLPAGSVETLIQPEHEEHLTALVRYWIVPDEALDSEAIVGPDGDVEMFMSGTMMGHRVAYRTEGDELVVNNARVVTADVTADNGVLHIVDAVLMPTPVYNYFQSLGE